MKYLIRDRSKSDCPILGSADLSPSATPSDLLALANQGHLWFQPERSKEDAEKMEQERLKNEAAIAQVQDDIDRVASKLPDGDYQLIELSGKQLKALCAKRGLATNGNKFDLIDRLQSAPVEAKPKAKKKKPEE